MFMVFQVLSASWRLYLKFQQYLAIIVYMLQSVFTLDILSDLRKKVGKSGKMWE